MTQQKVLIIGTTGAVGMATRDAITEYLGADVVAYDRPIVGAPEQVQEKQAERARKAELYEKLVESNGELLDGEQAKWLLKGRPMLDEADQGNVSEVVNYKDAIRKGVGVVVIAAGMPRKEGMNRKDVAAVNAPSFRQYGTDIADAVAEEIKQNDAFHLPVIINAGNPVDTMTEELGRSLHARLVEHVREARKEGNDELARRLAEEARAVTHKVIGQGGVLDGARLVTAIHETMNIPLENIRLAPVLGTHNDKMEIDFSNVVVRHGDDWVSLNEYPERPLEQNYGATGHTLAEELTARTRKGGSRILQDYKSKLDIDQSAVLATGAAVMSMVDAVVNDKQVEMPTVVYHIPDEKGRFGEKIGEGFVMGAMAKLGADGATYRAPGPAMAQVLQSAAAGARADYAEIHQR